MTKEEAIQYMKDRGFTFDAGRRVTFRVCNHEGNPLAPEKVSYKIIFWSYGERQRFGIWPNTVGYQGY